MRGGPDHLLDLKTGQPISMPSSYDEFSDSAHADYRGGTAEERAHRELLRETMEAEGFTRLSERMVALRLQGLAPVSHHEHALLAN